MEVSARAVVATAEMAVAVVAAMAGALQEGGEGAIMEEVATVAATVVAVDNAVRRQSTRWDTP
mgnify:CR=1 FL=1